ncbi:MAG TPA: hypothetical protein VFT79_11520 [Solirubrobacterales bacterium]|nr:hypothetical protein [Solirubrobacterales bacterium]
MRTVRLLAAAVLVALSLPAAAAHASFGFQSTEFSIYSPPAPGAEPGAVGPPQAQAGSHPYAAKFAFVFNQTTNSEGKPVPDAAVKNLEVDLPAGLVGDPGSVPACLASEFQNSPLFEQGCPAGSQIGTMKLDTTLAEVTLPIFNLEPPPGKVAQFGVLAIVAPMMMDASVRTDGDYGLRMTMRNLSQLLPVAGGVMTLWGVPADPAHDTLRGTCLGFEGQSLGECPVGLPRRPLLTLPVSCDQSLAATFRMDSWQNPGEFVSQVVSPLDSEGHPLDLEGCEALDFSPRIDVRSETKRADSPSGVEVDLRLPQSDNPDGYAEAAVRSVVLDLPPGLSLNPAAGDGLGSCSAGEVGLGSTAAPRCPDSSRIGSVTVRTPLIAEPLRGSVYLAAPDQNPFGSLLAAYVVAEGNGTRIKIPSRIDADAETGRLTVRMDELPQLPFSEFSLRFDGGPRAPLALPAECGDFTASARLVSYSAPLGAEPTALSSSFPVDRGCDGGFSPSFLGGATSAVAGHRTDLTLRLGRGEGEEAIDRFSTILPRGLLPRLAGVSSCPEPQAGTGDCPPSSRIGKVTVTAGAGSHPLALSGSAFRTDSYKGAPFGLSIAIPAAAGPLDLGVVVVRGRILVDPRSARLTIATDSLPRTLEGIPLRVRSFELSTTERPGMFSAPTSCGRQELGAEAYGATGTVASLSTPFFLRGCRELRFAPRISAETDMRASRRGGASLRMSVRSGASGQANLRSIKLDFPRQLSPRLSAIQGACPAATFAAGIHLCPPTSKIGRARVKTLVFEWALSGPVYLVSRGSEALPRIVLVLAGQGIELEFFGSMHVSRHGASSVTFARMPDAPISSFVIELPKGPHSALGASFLRGAGGSLCGRRISMATELTAYNGRRANRIVRVAAKGCRKGKR